MGDTLRQLLYPLIVPAMVGLLWVYARAKRDAVAPDWWPPADPALVRRAFAAENKGRPAESSTASPADTPRAGEPPPRAGEPSPRAGEPLAATTLSE